MPKYEQYCMRCGQGKIIHGMDGLCKVCGHDDIKFVKKERPHTEKLGIEELLDN